MIDVVTTEPIFTVPFLHLRVDDWSEKKEDILKLCIDKNLELRKDDFVNSDYHLLTDNKLPNYSERVGEILKQEIKTFNENQIPEDLNKIKPIKPGSKSL